MIINFNYKIWHTLLIEDLKLFSLTYEKNLNHLFFFNLKPIETYKIFKFNGSFSYLENEDWILIKESQLILLSKNLGLSHNNLCFFYEEPFYVESRSAMKYLHISKHWHPQRKKFIYRYLKLKKKENIFPLYLKNIFYFLKNKNVLFSEKFFKYKNFLSVFFSVFSKILFDNFYFDHKLKLSKLYNSNKLPQIWINFNFNNNSLLDLKSHFSFNYKGSFFKNLRPKKNKNLSLKLILNLDFYKNFSIPNIYLGLPKKSFESFTILYHNIENDPFFKFKSQFILKQSKISNCIFGNRWYFKHHTQHKIFNSFFFCLNKNNIFNGVFDQSKNSIYFNISLNKYFYFQSFYFNLMLKYPSKNSTYFCLKLYKNQIFYNLHINYFDLTFKYFLFNLNLVNFYLYSINIKNILKYKFFCIDFFNTGENSYTCDIFRYLIISDTNLNYNLNLILFFCNTNNKFTDSLFQMSIRFFEINRSRLLIKKKLDDHTIMYLESINHLKFAYNYYSDEVLNIFRIGSQTRFLLNLKFKPQKHLNLIYNLFLNYILNLNVFPKNKFRFEKIRFKKDTKPINYKIYHVYPKDFFCLIILYFRIYIYYPFIDKYLVNTFNKMNYKDEIRFNHNDSMGLFVVSRLHLKNHRVRFRNFLRKRKFFLIWLNVKKIYLSLSILFILFLILRL